MTSGVLFMKPCYIRGVHSTSLWPVVFARARKTQVDPTLIVKKMSRLLLRLRARAFSGTITTLLTTDLSGLSVIASLPFPTCRISNSFSRASCSMSAKG